MELDLIKFIVRDCAETTAHILKVGLVGSYARGDFAECSDIDFVFHMDKDFAEDVVLDLGTRLENIFYSQFNKKIDVIIYDNISKSIERTAEPLILKAYKQMEIDLLWLWERGVNYEYVK